MKVFRTTDAESEAQLVARIMAGDRDAEDELYKRYYMGVKMLVTRDTGNSSISADLAQETFHRVIEKIRNKELREPAKLPAFIWGVVRNLVIKHRKESRVKDHIEIDKAEHLMDPSPDQLDRILQEERSHIARRVLEQLRSERDREVLYRFYILEEDKEKICAELSLTSQRFNLVLFRARNKFKELYQKVLNEP